MGDAGWRSHAAGVNNALLNLGERGRLGDGAGGPGERDGVDPSELDSDASPGHAGASLGDTDQQQGKPAEQHMGADAGFDAVIDRPQIEVDFMSRNPRSASSRFLVAERDVLRADRSGSEVDSRYLPSSRSSARIFAVSIRNRPGFNCRTQRPSDA